MSQSVSSRPELASCEFGETVVQLVSGDLFAALAVDGAEKRAEQLEAVLKAVVGEGTRVVWVGNPLRSPLTIERFLIQIVGPEVDLRIERSPSDLACLFARRAGSETRLLVIVQQPETINPETIEQLGAMAGYRGGDEAVPMQFLFVGTQALRLPTALTEPPLPAAENRFEAGDWSVGALPLWRDRFPKTPLLLVVIISGTISLAPYLHGVAAPSVAQAAQLQPRVNLGEIEAFSRSFDGVPALRTIAELDAAR